MYLMASRTWGSVRAAAADPRHKTFPAGVNRISPAVIIGSELVQQSVSVYILCYLTADFIHIVPGPVLPGTSICSFARRDLLTNKRTGTVS